MLVKVLRPMYTNCTVKTSFLSSSLCQEGLQRTTFRKGELDSTDLDPESSKRSQVWWKPLWDLSIKGERKDTY